jgi:hypothetical protein
MNDLLNLPDAPFEDDGRTQNNLGWVITCSYQKYQTTSRAVSL